MPFPLIPLLFAGGSALAGLFGGKGQSPQQMAQMPPQAQPFLDALGKTADTGFFQGKHNIKASGKFLSNLAKYHQRRLGMNRNQLLEELGPELSTINQQAQGQQQALANFAPRSGGAVSAMADIASNRGMQIGNMIQSVRPRAANELADVASRMGTLGTASMGLSSGAAGNALSALLGQQQIGMQGQANRQQFYGGLGSSIGGILADIFKGQG